MNGEFHRDSDDFKFLTKPTGELPKPIAPPLPEVYQIETVATCNLACVMCPRQFFERKDKTKYLEMSLLEKIIDQGDFDASYFVELQVSGEPLLHPELGTIIDYVKGTGVKVGLSTNGCNIHNQMAALQKLDIITVSIDSLTNRKNIRRAKVGASDNVDLVCNVKQLLRMAEMKGIPVEMQVIELDGWEREIDIIRSEFDGFVYTLRTNPNCYHAFIHKDIPLPVSTDLCINPWVSASILANGNVTPCCISHGDDVIYGNLYHQTLREVWAGEEVKKFREEHTSKNYRDVCARCYMRSPYLFHQQMFFSSIRGQLTSDQWI